MSEPHTQLWTDDTSTEFAIFLDSNIVIKTNQDVQFTKKIDESVCMQGYSYDWKHTLSQWVSFLFGNKYQLAPEKLHVSNSPTAAMESQDKKSTLRKIRIPRPRNYSKIPKTTKPELNQSSRQKLKPNLVKCNYCNLKYYIDEERVEHEKFWHADKIA